MEKTHSDLYFDIYSNIYTQAQVHDLTSKIDALLFKIYQQKGTITDDLHAIFDADTASLITASAAKYHIDTTNYIIFQKFLLDIKEQVLALSSLTLFLAFVPGPSTLEKFSQFFLTALGRKFIFRIEVKKEIIGGVIIVYNGTYRDYSLKSKLKKIAEEMSNQEALTSKVSSTSN